MPDRGAVIINWPSARWAAQSSSAPIVVVVDVTVVDVSVEVPFGTWQAHHCRVVRVHAT